MNTGETPKELHSAWCTASGQQLNYQASERIFFEAHKLGFNSDDISIAVKHLQKFNAKSGGAKFRINAFKILGDPEVFASLVAEARANERNRRPPPSAKEQALETLRPTVDGESTQPRANGAGLHVKDIFKNLSQ